MNVNTIDTCINKYGRSIYITDDGWNSKIYNAFVQPLRYKNKMYLSGSFNELGHYGEGYYLYIGPAKENFDNLSKRALLHTADGMSYKIERYEKIFLKEIYWGKNYWRNGK